MKNALKLFITDLKRVAKTPAVWVILAGLAILPSSMLGSTYGLCGILIVIQVISRLPL